MKGHPLRMEKLSSTVFAYSVTRRITALTNPLIRSDLRRSLPPPRERQDLPLRRCRVGPLPRRHRHGGERGVRVRASESPRHTHGQARV
jgi:hypothetical protein